MDFESYFLQGVADGFKKEAGVKEGLKSLMTKVVGAGKVMKGGLLGRLLKGKRPSGAPKKEV